MPTAGSSWDVLGAGLFGMCNGTTHALPSMVNTHGKQQCPVNDVSVFDVHTLSKLVPLCVLHEESSKRLATRRNTKDKKHLQSTQSAQPTNLTDQAPSTTGAFVCAIVSVARGDARRLLLSPRNTHTASRATWHTTVGWWGKHADDCCWRLSPRSAGQGPRQNVTQRRKHKPCAVQVYMHVWRSVGPASCNVLS